MSIFLKNKSKSNNDYQKSDDKTFTKSKFLKLDLTQRQKKSAELIRIIYEKLLMKQWVNHHFLHYNELCKWLDLEPFNSQNLKDLADRYHYHLNLAKISLKEHNLLPVLRNIDGKNKEVAFLDNAIYLDSLRSAYNVGNIIRTAEALRIGSIYFDEKTPFIDNEKVQKTSMGSYQLTKCFNKFKLEDLPRPFIGIDTAEDSKSIYEFIFPKKFTLILGNEEVGISDKLLKEIDYLIEIPMLGFKNSINVSSAFAICANEIRRQIQ